MYTLRLTVIPFRTRWLTGLVKALKFLFVRAEMYVNKCKIVQIQGTHNATNSGTRVKLFKFFHTTV